MKIAIDKNSINAFKNDNNEYIYLFDDETYEELLEKNIHCMYYKLCNYVDINLTNYEIDCIKKAKITDKDWNYNWECVLNMFVGQPFSQTNGNNGY